MCVQLEGGSIFCGIDCGIVCGIGIERGIECGVERAEAIPEIFGKDVDGDR